MIKKLNDNIYAYLFIIAFVLFMFYQTMKLEYITSQIVPGIVCALVFILTVIALLSELHKIRQAANSTFRQKSKAPDIQKNQKSMVACSLWIFIFVGAVYLLGFFITTPLFLIVYIKRNGGTWFSSILTAFLFTSALYLVFDVGLSASLFRGKLFTL